MIPVKDHKGLYRDEKTNAILNCNDMEYEQYIKTKNQKISEENEIKTIKSDIEEIKKCLKLIMEGINK